MFSIDVMVSVHGAGLTNIVFMLPYSGLVEIFPPLFFEPYYRSIARNADLVYRSVRSAKIVNKSDYRYYQLLRGSQLRGEDGSGNEVQNGELLSGPVSEQTHSIT